MCQRVQCRKCGRPTWRGCGMHIEEALAGVPQAERCQCRERKAEDRGTFSPGAAKSWFSRLLGG